MGKSRNLFSLPKGWEALSNVLCNKSSIDATYQSNHTLEKFTGSAGENIPFGTASLLNMNRNPNKFEVARQKIIESHFLTGRQDAQIFLDMDLNAMPIAIAWMCRDDIGFLPLYEFLRKMPSLFELGQAQSKTKKRKHQSR